jgi:ADP-dependent NAD(P)H-hydrate dehydratase / NAD(P)H-hydrate epimerase
MDCRTALLTGAQMAEADRLTVATGTPFSELMDRAGKAVAREIVQRWPMRPVLVLCGPGNNGGDGFVTACALADAGWPVRVALLGTKDRLTGAAGHHANQWRRSIEPLEPNAIGNAALVVDAIFGSGLRSRLSGCSAATLAAVAERKLPIVAIDVPSGLAGDTGEALGAVTATLTVTFCRKKPGHVLLPGRLLCGDVVVADIGTPQSVLDDIDPATFENDPELWSSVLPWPDHGGHKYMRGHALISGGYPMTGAARLAALAAARMGAGLTTIAVTEVAFPIYASTLTSVMVRPLADPTDFEELLGDRRFTALLIGPGAGTDAGTRTRALAMLATGRPVLLDADAISVFQSDPRSLNGAIRGPCILTPHDGEFRRIFDATGDKLTRARCAAMRSGAVVVLKGSDTVIAAPDGRAIVNTNAPPTLATAGSGDVLSGMILGLLTQGMDPFLAGAAAVWMHGAAAANFGPGLIAEDLPDLLPGVLRGLCGHVQS